MNFVHLIGNLGADPEVKTLESGTTVARISLATSERWKDKDGNDQEETQWHDVTFWRGQAETVGRFARKGDKMAVTGTLRYRNYTDNEGIVRRHAGVTARDFEFLTPRPKDRGPSLEQMERPAEPEVTPPPTVVDVPEEKTQLPF